jgi:hypothetical protein
MRKRAYPGTASTWNTPCIASGNSHTATAASKCLAATARAKLADHPFTTTDLRRSIHSPKLFAAPSRLVNKPFRRVNKRDFSNEWVRKINHSRTNVI